MVRSFGGLLALFAFPILMAASPASAADPQPLAAGWNLERNVAAPSYAVAEPASTNLNIDSIVLSCEQGPGRRGLQLSLYLKGNGPLAPRGGAVLKDDPRAEFAIDGVSHAAQILFADDFVLLADSADGSLPILSEALVDALQTGRRLELRFDLVKEDRGQAPSFDSSAVVDLKAGPGSAAIAAVRQCADGTADQHLAETAPRLR